tara:strand:+ start:516 stop:680 length:165 start_codon:yes stop_codon:yes gene_type:complete
LGHVFNQSFQDSIGLEQRVLGNEVQKPTILEVVNIAVYKSRNNTRFCGNGDSRP